MRLSELDIEDKKRRFFSYEEQKKHTNVPVRLVLRLNEEI
jgi:hypothetical protein